MTARLLRLYGLFVKESLQMVRDPSTILVAFVLPFLLLILYGYGVSLDIDRLKVGLVIEDPSADASSLATAFRFSPYFDVAAAGDRRAFDGDLVSGARQGVIVIPQDFGRRLAAEGTAPVQVLTDGTQPNTGSFIQNYTEGTVQSWLRLRALEQSADVPPGIALEPRYWFNPDVESRYFLIPGSIAIIMTIIGTLLTSMVIAREWERGTMEAMLATPVGRFEILAGKLIPYFLLGMAAMAVCVAAAVLLFDVPLRGSIPAIALTGAVFLLPALGQGLFISAAARNQFIAAQGALLSGFLPAFLLSGFIFEIGSMPKILQVLTAFVPARYLVSNLQTLFLAGDVWPLLLPNLFALLAIGAVLIALSAVKTRKRLD